MCTLLLACNAHPRYRLVLAANRDEFYDRPTAAADWWGDAPQLYAGKDLVHGGSWLGVTGDGRVAALTNFRDPQGHAREAHSRGHLVSGFLKGEQTPEEYLRVVGEKRESYNGFNLLLGTPDRLLHYSNRSDTVTELESGIYGLSNHLLDTPWPKVVRGKAALARVLEGGEFSPEDLFAILADQVRPPDDELPDTGVGLEWERLLSSIFITSLRYGTRSSTVLLVDQDLHATFIERRFEKGTAHDTSICFDWSKKVPR